MTVRVAGLLLAAGAGSRMGRPKATVELDGEPLVRRAVRTLRAAGLDPVVVVLGAGLPDVARLLDGLPDEGPEAPPGPGRLPDHGTTWTPAVGWDTEGQAASLRAGLELLEHAGADVGAALVTLVDTPGLDADALRRVADHAGAPDVLARGAVDGRLGHPVLLGRAHWPSVRASAHGDAGARGFLRGRDDVVGVEIGDVATDVDLDTPEDLARWTAGHHDDRARDERGGGRG